MVSPEKPVAAKSPRRYRLELILAVFFGLAAFAAIASAGYSRLEHHDSRSPVRPAADTSNRTAERGPGAPWGELARAEHMLMPAAERLRPCDAATPVRWYTDADMRAGIAQASAGPAFTVAQRAGITAALACPGGGTCEAEMDPDLVLSLSPEARAAIYPILGRSPANPQQGPFRFRGESELRARLAGLSAPSRELFHRLLYPDHGYPAFADIPTLCHRIPDGERVALVAALNATPALRVQVRAPAAVAAAVAGWYGQPSLAAELARGDGLDLRDLLPPMPRARLDTYPTEADLATSSMNCFWTALNFFRADPDPRYGDPATVRRVLAEEYVEIPAAEARFGDVFTWEDEAGRPVHAAAYLADDIFFTRNGFVSVRPFILMARADLDERYPGRTPRVLRRRAP